MGRGTRFEEHSYDDAGRSGSHGVKWNAIALIGRQSLILVFSVVLARVLGPQAYGIIAQASIYIALTTLLLDQGLTAALISKKSVTRSTASAATTVNLALAFALLAVTAVLAAPIATFFATPELRVVLMVLAGGLVLKAAAIVPRMLLMRQMKFTAIAVADVGGSLAGGAAGVVAAIGGLDYWALVIQLVVSDLFAAAVLVVAARPPGPSLRLAVLRDDLGFSVRVFFGNFVSFASRNVDNILIGRFFGADALAYYSLAYRVLLTPVQMVGQVVTRVLFPAIARVSSDVPQIGALIVRSTSAIALLAFPAMAFVAVSAPDAVPLILGTAWAPAIPVLQVLAITGARQAVTSVNGAVLLGLGLAKTHLRFNILAAAVQILGMAAGVPWGIFGVATGYTIAGIILTPVIFWLQVKHAGLSWRTQVKALVAPFNATLAASATYLVLSLSPLDGAALLVCGLACGVLVYAGVLWFFYRDDFRRMTREARAIVRGS
ncbi:MAG: lipopolysaccharide biosynthesis protein [Microbacterium sp.]